MLSNGQLIGKFPRELSKTQSFSEDQKKIKDVRPNTCILPNAYYPVFVENFDNKGELPNRFRFDFSDVLDNGFTEPNSPCLENTTWFGDAFENNITIVNGICSIEIKEQEIFANPATHSNSPCNLNKKYYWTSGAIQTLSKFNYGAFVARIALPYNIYTWPALWLYGGEPNRFEIDIFEFYDKDITKDNCTVFENHQMTSKSWLADRSDKYPVDVDFFGQDKFHVYELAWTPYRIDIWVDSNHVGHANRYYSKGSKSWISCRWNESKNDPIEQFSCTDLMGMNGNKKILEDLSWPTTQYGPLGFYFNNHITNDNIKNDLSKVSACYSYSNSGNLISLIDYIKVYQPVSCSTNTYVCSTGDLLSQTQGTNFASGLSLYFGGTNSNCGTLLEAPKASNGWNPPPPLHCFAVDEIAFEQDFGVEEGQYMEASIINPPCGNEDFSARSSLDSICPYKSVQSMYSENGKSEILPEKIDDDLSNSETHIKLFPNPVVDNLNILIIDDNLSDQLDIEIARVDIITIENKLVFSLITEGYQVSLDVSDLARGIYFVKIYFTNNQFKIKKFCK